jgi:hypothetical protein
MYKLYKDIITGNVSSVFKANENETMTSIPFSPDNSDYQQFKKDLAAAVELQDATGTVMTPAQITAFVATLP